MPIIYTEITLANSCEASLALHRRIKDEDVHRVTVNAIVDTGASSLVISEELKNKLALAVEARNISTLADGSVREIEITEPVKILWKDRVSVCRALVLPNADEVLLGALPLEDMDLIIHPKEEKLIGAHGDEVMRCIKTAVRIFAD